MKNKDIFYISRLNYKRNKVAKSIIINLTFTIFSMIFYFFITISFNNTLFKSIESDKKSLQVVVNDEDDYKQIINKYDVNTIEFYKKEIKYKDVKEEYILPHIVIDDVDYEISYGYNDYDIEDNNRISLIKNDLSIYYFNNEKYVFDSISQNDKLILKGMASRKENTLMISSLVLDYLKLDYNSVLNKMVTLINDNDVVIKNFKITGVYDYRPFCKDVRQDDPIFILTNDEFNNLDKTIKQELRIEFKKLSDELNALLDYPLVIRDEVNNYNELKPIINFIKNWLLIIGLIIGIITIINLFIQMEYYVSSKKNFKNYLKLIGVNAYEYQKILFYQIGIYFLKSMLFAIPLSLIGCIAFDYLYKLGLDNKTNVLSYGLINYLIVIAIVSLLVLILMVLFVAILSKERNISKDERNSKNKIIL